MRTVLGLVVVLAWGMLATAGDKPAAVQPGGVKPSGDKPVVRFGVAADLKEYPQGTPEEALGSVVKAVGQKRIDYLLAQLAEPAFVDARVKTLGGSLEPLRAEATERLVGDPGAAKLLARFQKEGLWNTGDTEATVRVGEQDRFMRFRRGADGRWYLVNENRNKPEPRRRF